ncbi:MAG: hypothetical protein OQL19_17485 [Gammaproteobacteria bacterium]|nr:hypothetical protein [Gammaproteobacteria bacterium]
MNKIFDSILNGLSSQYAGEYLSSSDKEQILNHRSFKNRIMVPSPQKNVNQINTLNNQKRRIAMLCNDATNENVINYVLGNANDCSVDILYHGVHKTTSSGEFYTHARNSFSENNVDVSIVKLINDSIEEIKDYLISHRSLQYLVTDSHDQLMGSFLKNKAITNQLQIPIVLIN